MNSSVIDHDARLVVEKTGERLNVIFGAYHDQDFVTQLPSLIIDVQDERFPSQFNERLRPAESPGIATG